MSEENQEIDEDMKTIKDERHTKQLLMPMHYVNSEKRIVVALVNYETMSLHQNSFLNLFPGYSIYAVWSKDYMNEIVFLIEHGLDPFIGTNVLLDMTLAYVNKYHKKISKRFPIEIAGDIYQILIFKDDSSTVLLPFSYEVYSLFCEEYGDEFNRSGFVIFGPESNKVNAKRHRLLDEKKCWPNY